MTPSEPRTDPLLCPDCGHHLHRPNPGACQWRDCSCGAEAAHPIAASTDALRAALSPWTDHSDGSIHVDRAEDVPAFLDAIRAALAATPPSEPMRACLSCGKAKVSMYSSISLCDDCAPPSAHPATEGLHLDPWQSSITSPAPEGGLVSSTPGSVAATEGLDVERLRQSMTEKFTDGDGGQGVRYRTPEEVAAEYARLSSPEGQK